MPGCVANFYEKRDIDHVKKTGTLETQSRVLSGDAHFGTIF